MDIPYLLAHPDELNQETLYDLRRIVGVYPTYHAARILYLQNLFLLHDTTFDQELRRAALLVPDRRVLCNITQYGGLQPILDRKQQTAASDTTTQDQATKEVAATNHDKSETMAAAPAEANAAPSQAHEASATGSTTPQRRPRKKYVNEDTTLKLLNNFFDSTPAPLQRRRVKADPSTDYMAYLSQAEDNDNENAELSSTLTASDALSDDNGLRMEQLIDGFITSFQNGIKLSENPDVPEDILIDPDEADITDYVDDTEEAIAPDETIEPIETTATIETRDNAEARGEVEARGDDSVASAPIAEPENATAAPTAEAGLTETLANIYIKQQKYDRALEVMTKMQASASNANPYLADQVRFLQKLAINNRHKR